MAGIEGERRQHRADVGIEIVGQIRRHFSGVVRRIEKEDSGSFELRPELGGPGVVDFLQEPRGACPDRTELLAHRHPVRRRRIETGSELPRQRGDADHVELVEVVGGDGEELDALEQGVRALGAGRFETLRSVTLPGALPYILTGIRSGLGFGWRALIAAELVGAPSGLGQMIFAAGDYHRSDIIIAGCLIIGVIAIAMDRWILYPIERRTVQRWGMITDAEKEGV